MASTELLRLSPACCKLEKQTFVSNASKVCFGSKADICSAKRHVRFVPIADIAVHSITGREQRLRNGQAERFCGLEIDDQFDFRQ